MLVVAALSWPLAAFALSRAGAAQPDPRARFDAIVVLGCPVRADGSISATLARRIERGCALLRAGAAPTLVISGGGAPISEARAALAYIESRGLASRDAVVLEEASVSTRTNASCTRALLGDVRVLVVTDDWHVPRARIVFGSHFASVAFASTKMRRLRGAMREVPLYLLARARAR